MGSFVFFFGIVVPGGWGEEGGEGWYNGDMCPFTK